MQTTVKKSELINILQENRSKHRTVFEAALQGYYKEALERLEKEIHHLRDNRTVTVKIFLDRPEDHTIDYDRVIKMLDMDVNETFTLEEHQFAQYVMDDWSWKRQWLKMSSHYAPDTSVSVYGAINDDVNQDW